MSVLAIVQPNMKREDASYVPLRVNKHIEQSMRWSAQKSAQPVPDCTDFVHS
jgi:hypothetical protein